MSQTISPFIPAQWTNQKITLFHGTIATHIPRLLQGIDVTKGNPQTDFGRGFYTTTVLRQAHSWAWQLAQRQAKAQPAPMPAVVAFDVDRNDLAGLEALWFVRGSFDADEFWGFIFHCRAGSPDHARGGAKKWYDLVIGPVAASWRQRLTIYDADQISFRRTRRVYSTLATQGGFYD